MLNKIILIGHVGKDPEIRTFYDSKVANFTLATSETFKDKNGEKQTATEWHNIVLWRSLAEIGENYIRKGQLLYVEGKMTSRKWVDKEGENRFTYEVVGSEVRMLGGTPEKKAELSRKPEPKPEPEPIDEMGGDLPF